MTLHLKITLATATTCLLLALPAIAQPTQTTTPVAVSEAPFSWDLAKKTIARAYPRGRFRPIAIVGYQFDGPSRAPAYLHFEGGGTVRVLFVQLSTDSGQKWFLIPEGNRDEPPFPVE